MRVQLDEPTLLPPPPNTFPPVVRKQGVQHRTRITLRNFEMHVGGGKKPARLEWHSARAVPELMEEAKFTLLCVPITFSYSFRKRCANRLMLLRLIIAEGVDAVRRRRTLCLFPWFSLAHSVSTRPLFCAQTIHRRMKNVYC